MDYPSGVFKIKIPCFFSEKYILLQVGIDLERTDNSVTGTNN